MQALEANTRRLSTRRSPGRVANALAAMFRQRLSVPQIYLKPRIAGQSGLDLLAVDKAGSGDVHGVDIKVGLALPTNSGILPFVRPLLKPLRELPVHFRYLAFNTVELDTTVLEKLNQYEELFDREGIGRVGILAFDDRLLNLDLTPDANFVKVVVAPERFLLRGQKLARLEKFLTHAHPDIDVRM